MNIGSPVFINKNMKRNMRKLMSWKDMSTFCEDLFEREEGYLQHEYMSVFLLLISGQYSYGYDISIITLLTVCRNPVLFCLVSLLLLVCCEFKSISFWIPLRWKVLQQPVAGGGFPRGVISFHPP